MFKMRFEFDDRSEVNLEQINAALSNMCLSDLNVEDSGGYLSRTFYRDSKGRQLGEAQYGYGFDHVEFACEADPDEGLMTWQVYTAAFPKEARCEAKAFADRWREENPQNALRVLMHIEYEQADAFVVLYHGKD